MTSPLDEVLRRLELLERRMTRLEASAGIGRSAVPASNADAFRGAPVAGSTEAAADPREHAPTAPAAAAAGEQPNPAPAPAVAAGDEPKSYSPTAIAPATERLSAVPHTRSAWTDDPFPDLSQLDEKLQVKKGPAQRIEVRAALEDYPRIATRIQQLWGTPECEAYINNLVIDTRGNRKGFPPPMMEELLYLGRLARALVILGIGGDLWDSYDQIGDRR
ncbi:MAG: hypothetical protein IT531_18090 [Burkholderiales bacterium]|nr:hypothetical protein [Burkholderiales bacterium]